MLSADESEKLSDKELYFKLLGKTPFVKPWMEPWLPDFVVLRDAIVIFFVWLFGTIVSLGTYFSLSRWFSNDTAGFLSLVPASLTLLGLAAVSSRYAGATAAFWVTKKGRKR